MCRLQPDLYLPTYDALTPEYLKEKGICALILDVDNTLAPYEQPHPDQKLLAWMDHMTRSGISLCVVSNNHTGRIELFCQDMQIPVIPAAHKPMPKGMRRAMAEMQSTKETTAAMGDQIFTDIWAARWAKLKWAILVPPIRDKRDLFTRFKRLCEKPVMRRYRKKNKT